MHDLLYESIKRVSATEQEKEDMAHHQAVTLWFSSISIAISNTPHHLPQQIIKSFPTNIKRAKFIGRKHAAGGNLGVWRPPKSGFLCVCKAQMDSESNLPPSGDTQLSKLSDSERTRKRVSQIALWIMEGVYICWLFLLPYAPGDPVWAIKPYTITILLDLSLNFFFILPLANSAGFHLMEAPVLHPTSEALFNFVIGWTVMFAPLLFTDRKRDRFGGSLEVLWVVQMFLTNTLLIPYMAIRLGENSRNSLSKSHNIKFGIQSIMISGARVIGIIGGFVGLISVLWALFGRGDTGFGNLADRWNFFVSYVEFDRPAYAFLWDICLYSIFQPWLIGDNLDNVDECKIQTVRYLRFVPYVGLVAYLWGLARNEDQ
eukprot:Gb_31608 [translate_table: standard]